MTRSDLREYGLRAAVRYYGLPSLEGGTIPFSRM
jgi:hypothetical protein